MSHSATREALLRALNSENTPVVALRGDWGTGKTFLWRSVSDELIEQQGYAVLYLSALAFKNVDEMKTALLTDIVSRAAGIKAATATGWVAPSAAATTGALAESLLKIAEYARHFLPEGLQTRFSDAYALLPKVRKLIPEKLLIAIDDIERPDNIDMAQLLGFVSYLVDELKVQLVLILNTEKLEGERKTRWQQMQEKIISRTIGLHILPEEAVSIALDGLPEPEANAIREYTLKLGVSNIRIIQHIRRNWLAIRGQRSLDTDAISHLVKSVVLFTALHLEATALEDWPSTEFVLNTAVHAFSTEDEKINGWLEKVHEYGLGYPDALETDVLLPFLSTGHMNQTALDSYLAEIKLRMKQDEITYRIRDLATAYHWDVHYSRRALTEQVNGLLSDVKAMTPRQASELAEVASWDDPDIAEQVINTWIGDHRTKIEALNLDESYQDNLSSLHPRIANLYLERLKALFPPLTVLEAIRDYRNRGAYGIRNVTAINNATQENFENLLRDSPPSDQKELFAFFVKFKNGQSANSDFSPAADVFFHAVASIINAGPYSRAATVYKRALKAANLEVRGDGIERVGRNPPNSVATS